MNGKIFFWILLFSFLVHQNIFSQGVGINETGDLPNTKAILDIASSSKGLLIPRMTTAQRDAITSPPAGLQVYNLTTNTIDVFRGGIWESLAFADGRNVVKVSSLADLPAPQSNAITLDATKIYVFSGIVNISPYYINLNGAGIKGNMPEKDGVSSNVSGAVLRSSGANVYIKSLTVLTLSGATKAYDLNDATGGKQCDILESIVVQSVAGLGVGNITGFAYINVSNNYWNCADGIKVAGTVGEFIASYNQIANITAGSGIEFLTGLNIDFIDLANNSFIYSGQTGIKLNTGATFNIGRMTVNFFKATVGTPITGFSSATPGWEMTRNTRIPDTRSYGLLYMNENATATPIPAANTFVKVVGTTTSIKLDKFTSSASNRFTYVGKRSTAVSIFVAVAGASPASSTDITIAIAKNGTVIPSPSMATRGLSNNQSYHLSMESEVDMLTNDYIEVFIRSNNTNSVVVKDMQFRVQSN